MKSRHKIGIGLALLGLIGTAASGWISSSLASTCSGTTSDKWACGSTVYYSLSGFDTTQAGKIVEGIAEWNSLTISNKVTLTAAGGGHSANLQFIASTTGDNCTSGHYDTHGSPTVTSAEIYYHFSNTCAPRARTFAWWRFSRRMLNASTEHLNKLGLSGLEVRSASLDSLHVRGTPTLILVNDKGEVTDQWVGKLPPEREAEVIEKINSGT